MDKIQIKNLEIFANHGVFPEENKLGQNLSFPQPFTPPPGRRERRTI